MDGQSGVMWINIWLLTLRNTLRNDIVYYYE